MAPHRDAIGSYISFLAFLMLSILALMFPPAYRLARPFGPALSQLNTFSACLALLLRIDSSPTSNIRRSANEVLMSLSELPARSSSASIRYLSVAKNQQLLSESPRSSRVELSAQPQSTTCKNRLLRRRPTQYPKLSEANYTLFDSELIPSPSRQPQPPSTADCRGNIRSAPHKACVTQSEDWLTET
jgi:hypothetical protein